MLFSMQVACGCQLDPDAEDSFVSPCDNLQAWDGPSMNGFVRGRRYVWKCQTCGNTICVNLTSMEDE